MRTKGLTGLVLLLISFSACEYRVENPSPLTGLTKLEEGYVTGASVKAEIWGERKFMAGYNKLWVVLYDSLHPSQKVIGAHIHFEPELTFMKGSMNSCIIAPSEDPEELAVNGVFPGAVVFPVPTSDTTSWKLNLEIHDHMNDMEGETQFDLMVDDPEEVRTLSFVSQISDRDTLFVTLVKPLSPSVGRYDLEVAIFSADGTGTIAGNESYTVGFKEEMLLPGTATGSGMDLLNAGKGHYKGTISFPSFGRWKVTLKIREGNEIVSDTASFIITI